MFLSVGFFAILWVMGNLDYATVFSVAPMINESSITLIGLLLFVGAMAKSRQLGLHRWLPNAMEGKTLLICIITFAFIYNATSIYNLDIIILQARLPLNLNPY